MDLFGHNNITIPTYLTIFRILLSPCVASLIVLEKWNWALVIFSVAALTDLLDGIIARTFQLQTDLGACLDPIADKLLLISCFFALFYNDISPLSLPLWFLIVVVAKEISLIVGLFSICLFQGHFLIVRSRFFGKLAMGTQTLFVLWIFLCHYIQLFSSRLHQLLLGIITINMLLALLQYIYATVILVRGQRITYE